MNVTDSGQDKITLFLMTQKGLHFLQRMYKQYGPLFTTVVVGSDKAIDNDHELEIIRFCDSNGIPVVRRRHFKKITSEYALAVSWRWLIQHPPEKLIVFHDSLLPRYRGFAPLVNALINGEHEVGVTALFGAHEFDTGEIIAQSKSKITYPMTIQQAIEIVTENYLDCAKRVLDILLAGGTLPSTPQNEEEATYSVWRDEQDYVINWSRSSAEIRRLVDAVGFPYKGASARMAGSAIRVLAVEEATDVKIENRNAHIGKVLFLKDDRPVVICGSGMIKILVANESDSADSIFPLPSFRVRFS